VERRLGLRKRNVLKRSLLGSVCSRTDDLLGHEPGELQRERSMGLAGNRVHDERGARVAGVLELGLHLLMQQQLHELQRDLRQRADRHQ
jgi:hypothetical protein